MFKGKKEAMRVILCWFIAIQIAWGPSVYQLSHARGTHEPTFTNTEQDLNIQFSEESRDRLDFDVNDPAIDQDPFFMRSQQWLNQGNGGLNNNLMNEAFEVLYTDNFVQIRHPSSSALLQINRSLVPIIETDDYLLFSLSEHSDLFRLASNVEAGEEEGQGFFVIRKLDFFASATDASMEQSATPLPVFFFPLPGTGWTGALEAIELQPMEQLGLWSRDGDSLLIDIVDIDHIIQAQMRYLIFASFLEMRKNIRAHSQAMMEAMQSGKPGFHLGTFLPPRGSTAAFGLFFTGLDLDNPQNSLWVQIYEPSQWQRAVALLSQALLPKAHAEIFTDDTLDRFIIIGTILGGLLAASVAAKYTVLRDYMKKRREGIEERERMRLELTNGLGRQAENLDLEKEETSRMAQWWDNHAPDVPDFLRPGQQTRKDIKDILDLYAHFLTTTFMLVPNTAGYALEYVGDRFLPLVAAGDNQLVRRFMNRTFLWVRNTSQNIVVNWKTWLLGAPVMGVVDNSQILPQLVLVAPLVADVFAQGLQALGVESAVEKVEAAFDISNPNRAQFVTSEIIRNIVAYMMIGAHAYSQEQRMLVIENIKKEVERLMALEGMDPLDPQKQKAKEKLIEQLIDKAMVLRGLPDAKQHIFDAGDINRGIARLWGYRVPTAEELSRAAVPSALQQELSQSETNENSANSPNEEAAMSASDHFVLESGRWGLVRHALRKALKEAKDSQLRAPGATGPQVVDLLEESLKKFSLAQALMRNPLRLNEAIKEAREVRLILTLLSYEGPTHVVLRYVPEPWKEATSPEVATTAARLFRQALFSLIVGDPKILTPSRLEQEIYGKNAEEKAREQMVQWGMSPEEDPYLLETLTQDFISKLVAERQNERDIANYQYDESGWFARWQQRRADNRAIKRLAEEQVGRLSLPDVRSRYQELYAYELGKIVGLYVEEGASFLHYVHNVAQTKAKKELEGEALNSYMERLGEVEAARLQSQIYALNFLDAYKELAVDSEDYLESSDPQKPGRFQRLRQQTWVKDREWLTKTLRVVEASFSTGSYRPGLIPLLERTLPTFYDFKSGFAINLRQMPTLVTTSYLANYYLWQVHLPYPVWIALGATNWFIIGATAWLTRLLMNIGIKPMGDIPSKALYALIFSWATWWGYVPVMTFNDDIQFAWNQHIYQPLSEWTEWMGKLPTALVDWVAEMPQLFEHEFGEVHLSGTMSLAPAASMGAWSASISGDRGQSVEGVVAEGENMGLPVSNETYAVRPDETDVVESMNWATGNSNCQSVLGSR